MTSNVIKPTAIGSIGAVLTGRTPPASNPELFGDVYPFITPTDMDGVSRHADTERFLSELGAEEFRRILLPAGAVCVVCIGATIGKVCMTSRPSFTNQQINAIVVDRTRHDPVFVFHALRQLRSELQAKAGGAATPIINKSTFSGVDLLLPPRPIQEAAGKILSAYDDLIANCERRIKVLDEMVRSLYREWFVEFRCPGHEGNGALPSDWRKTTADAVAVETRRNVPKGDVDAAARYVGLEHIPRRSLALDSWEEVRELGSNKLRFEEGEVLFGKIRPYFHKVAVAPLAGLCSADTFVITSRTPALYSFVVGLVSSDQFVAHASATANGAKMPRGNWDVMMQFPVVVPPAQVLARFDAIVRPWLNEQRNLVLRSRNLREARELLLPRLLCGQLPVAEAA